MKKIKEKAIIELLKSGDFTVAYHNNCELSLYIGRHKYEQLENLEEEDEVELDNFDSGYCPEIVRLLVKALGGKSDSI